MLIQSFQSKTGVKASWAFYVALGLLMALPQMVHAQGRRGENSPAPASADPGLKQLLAKSAEAPQMRVREPGLKADQASAQEREPATLAAAFFGQLAENQVDEAFAKLTEGSALAQRERDLTLFRERTRQIIHDYGNLSGHELLEEKYAGSHLLRLTYISLTEKYPMRWRLYFYKSGEQWEIIDMRVDDNLRALFQEDAAIPGPGLAERED